MMRSIVVSPDNFASSALRQVLDQNASVIVQRHVQEYPTATQVVRLLRSCSPEFLFLSAANMTEFERVYRLIEAEAPGLPVVAFGESPQAVLLQHLMRLGVREYLAPPFTALAVQEVIARAAERSRKDPVQRAAAGHLYTFFPAKPGVGASTIAMNVAAALADQLQLSTLLMDCDLSAGIQQWMLRLNNTYALPEAVARSAELDDDLWPQLVDGRGKLDLLAAGLLNPSLRVDLAQLNQLLSFARQRYRILCADLSGNLERYSTELMMESKRIFLVTTPEMAEVYLASEKLRWLYNMELGARVQLIVNRTGANQVVSVNQIEQLVGLPAAICFPNSYAEVNRSYIDGVPLHRTTALGKQYRQLAGTLAASLAASNSASFPVSAERVVLDDWIGAPLQTQASTLLN